MHSHINHYRDDKLLEKYGLKANDAILAEEKHMGLYEDLLQNYNAKLIAGGAAQNTARGAQVCHIVHVALMILTIAVYPTTKFRRLHWLCWKG